MQGKQVAERAVFAGVDLKKGLIRLGASDTKDKEALE
jgi:hypothetical protein